MSRNNEQKRTRHRLIQGDARDLSFLPDASIHLVVTSPPYWTLKRYNEHPDQLGHVKDYEEFLGELEKVCFRVLVPGGRLVCVVGDVCLSRRAFGRHVVVPLHADIAVMCRKIGFDNLNPIIWHKIANASLRKSGGYRKPTQYQRDNSRMSKEEFDAWFRQFWNIPGESTRKHPAPFPFELAYRLVRMFSFIEDTVLDPFSGTGTTMFAAMKTGRNSIGIEIDSRYIDIAERRLRQETGGLFAEYELEVKKSSSPPKKHEKPVKHVRS